MVTFLFWNLMGNQQASWEKRHEPLRTHISRMASSFGVDVFMFAESAFESGDLVRTLNQAQAGQYSCPDSQNERIQIVTRFEPSALVSQHDSDDERLTIRHLRTKSTAILLAVIHFQSRAYWSERMQASEATVLRESISNSEKAAGHQRTVLVGDLNMNPFHPGVAAAHGLNAVMARDLARREQRTVATKSYRFFYNPMWGHFGDRRSGPPGTFFYSGSDFYWNMFDQVMLRPALMDSLHEVRILDRVGERSLLTRQGRPRSSETSDHLPILFRLNL